MPLPITGDIAHDAVDAGKPVKIGGQANSTAPTPVAPGKRVGAWWDPLGRLVIVHEFPSTFVSATHGPVTVNLTATSNAELVAAPSSGNSIHVTQIMVGNNGAEKVTVLLKDGTTTRVSQPLAANGGGFVFAFSPPWKLANAAALNGALSAIGDVDVTVMFTVSP